MFSKKVVVIVLLGASVLFLYIFDTHGTFGSLAYGLKKNITLISDTKKQTIEKTRAKTVCDLLSSIEKEKVKTDRITPPCEERVVSNMEITISSRKVLRLVVDGQEKTLTHFGTKPLREIARDGGIEIGKDDIIKPDGAIGLEPVEHREVIRVEQRQMIEKERILFQEMIEEDEEKEVGFEEIVTKGEEGEQEVTYEITYHNAKQVEKKEIDRKVIREKIDRVVIRGVKSIPKEEDVRLGKSHTGQASWYAYKDCDCAANPWLPKGSRVKVTAVNSGKSVVVKINDRGPFVEGRIIDLDKTAFEKIAPLGAGVIDIKMEEIIE